MYDEVNVGGNMANVPREEHLSREVEGVLLVCPGSEWGVGEGTRRVWSWQKHEVAGGGRGCLAKVVV